ncbi:MAG: type II secretion system F family protein, partial [Anaerolineae bacterium]|nr:type II secretion system F family protein [Anaerolineae bacterium]
TLESTTRMLELAGNPRNMRAAEFIALRIGFTVFLGAFIFLMMGQGDSPLNRRLLFTLGALAIGWFMPAMMLRSKADRRKAAVIKKLPDALDLMTICVDAGLVFNAAMQKS